jgi:hypothetical protein
MDLTNIDLIPAPADPATAADFDVLRALLRRHAEASQHGNQSAQHRSLMTLLEKRCSDADTRERHLLERPLPPAHDAQERREQQLAARALCLAYGELAAALTGHCGHVCLR